MAEQNLYCFCKDPSCLSPPSSAPLKQSKKTGGDADVTNRFVGQSHIIITPLIIHGRCLVVYVVKNVSVVSVHGHKSLTVLTVETKSEKTVSQCQVTNHSSL